MRNSSPRRRPARHTQPETWLGFTDARANLGFPPAREYDSWNRRVQENYECGRLVFHNIVLAGLKTRSLNPMSFRTARAQAIALVGSATPGPNTRPETLRSADPISEIEL